MRLSALALLLVLFGRLSGCAPSQGGAAPVQPGGIQEQVPTIALAIGGTIALVPQGTGSFVVDPAGSGGVSFWQPISGGLRQMLPAAFVAALGGHMAYNGIVQGLVEGPVVYSVDGVEYTIDRATQSVSVRVFDPLLAEAAAAQIALETDSPLYPAQVQAQVQTAELALPTAVPGSKGQAAVVVADDDPADLAAMAVAAKAVMELAGYTVTVYSCLNDFVCIQTAALSGGPEGTQAVAVFLDGGFVGMEVPVGITYPPVRARTVPQKNFYAGPWIAVALREFGFRGAIFYISTEGWQTIRHFQGQGAELGPTWRKDWFFPGFRNFLREILGEIANPRGL